MKQIERERKKECKIERHRVQIEKQEKTINHSNNKNKSTSQNVSEWRRERQR